MNADELDAAWRGLRTPDTPERLEAVAVADGGVWAAIDHEGYRHLLVQMPNGTEAPASATRGLQVSVARHQVHNAEPAEYLDLKCLSEEAVLTFTAVAADIGASAGGAPHGARLQEASAALARWQWFWGVDPSRLSDRDALGLFAELWFLHRWTAGGMAAINAWTASMGSRHDFQWQDYSVEVKAATRRADGTILHRIQHLDQLTDPEQGRLFLFSLRVVHDQLARNSLPDLIDRISEVLREPQTRDEFHRKLGQRGYSPAHRRRYETPYRVLGENLYSVAGSFPRLATDSFVGGLAPGIADVSYVIDMAVCGPWLVATGPEGWPRCRKSLTRLGTRRGSGAPCTQTVQVVRRRNVGWLPWATPGGN